jgi:acetyl-CoA synthetase
VLVSHERVIEAAAIGAADELKGNVIVAFAVVTGEGDEELARELSDLVAAEMGKPLRPAAVHFVSAIPKTRNGKVMRRLIRAAWQGQEPGDLMALENPAAVEEIRRLAEV